MDVKAVSPHADTGPHLDRLGAEENRAVRFWHLKMANEGLGERGRKRERWKMSQDNSLETRGGVPHCSESLWQSAGMSYWISNRVVDSVATAEIRMPEYPTNTLLPRRIRGEVPAPTAHERPEFRQTPPHPRGSGIPSRARRHRQRAPGGWSQALLMWPVWPLISSITAQLHTSLSQHRPGSHWSGAPAVLCI